MTTDTVPRISVVMPLYNAEKHVEMSIRSALASDLEEIELIVVDDGSTDNSLAVVRAIRDPRVIVISQQASGGPATPRNIGITRARAPYVALLDADDLVKAHKFSSAAAALDRHPSAGIAFGQYERIDAEGQLLDAAPLSAYPVFRSLPTHFAGCAWRLISQPHFSYGLAFENFIGTSGVVLRKSALKKTGLFDPSLTFSEDRDLWFRLAHICDALYEERLGHSYRANPSGLTFRPGAHQARQRITVLRRECGRRFAANERKQLGRLIAENLLVVSWDHRMNGRPGAALGTFLQAVIKAPRLLRMRAATASPPRSATDC